MTPDLTYTCAALVAEEVRIWHAIASNLHAAAECADKPVHYEVLQYFGAWSVHDSSALATPSHSDVL